MGNDEWKIAVTIAYIEWYHTSVATDHLLMHRLASYILVFAVSLLAATGIVMLTSTSYHLMEKGAQEYAKVEHQSAWLIGAALAGLAMALVHYRWLYRLRWWIFGLA